MTVAMTCNMTGLRYDSDSPDEDESEGFRRRRRARNVRQEMDVDIFDDYAMNTAPEETTVALE